MLTSPRSLFAAGVLVATTFTSTLASASTQNAKVPENYASLVPENAYAVGWVDNVDAFLASAKPLNIDAPSSMKQLISSILAVGPDVQIGNSVIAWAAAGPSLAGEQPGDPQIFFAINAPGGNAQNIHAGSDTTLHFSGDMVIAAMNTEWTKPDGAASPLISILPSNQIAIVVDVEKIWKDQGQQIQMLGGFGAMAAQMALMEQSQNADPSEKARIREAQKKAGEVMRNSMAGIFSLIKTMDTMTIGLGLGKEMFSLDLGFNFNETVGGTGVNTKTIDRLPAGMPFYYAMNANLTQWLTSLELNLEDALMIGLSKKQHSDFDAIIPMITDLADTITGGMAVCMDLYQEGILEYTEIQVQDSQEFINGLDLVMEQVDTVDLGVNYTKDGNDTWNLSFDGQQLAASMDNPKLQQIDEIPFIKKGVAMNVSSEDDFVTIKAVMGEEDNANQNSNATIIRDMLRAKRSHNLMFGAVIDVRSFALSALRLMTTKQQQQELAGKIQTLKGDGSPIPISMLGSFRGKTFEFNFDADLDIIQFQNDAKDINF